MGSGTYSQLYIQVVFAVSLISPSREKRFTKFEWQEGYGAFSYSHSALDHVIAYIKTRKNIINEDHLKKNTYVFPKNIR
nr:hypothetical protein [Sinomicrobium weinanense]